MSPHQSAELGMARTRTIAGFHLKEFAQPPHRRLPWHEHHSASICFVVSGSYAERMRGEERECPPQSLIFKPAAERHADEFGRDGGTCLLIEIGEERLKTTEPISDITTRPSVVRTTKLAAMGHRIYREFTGGDVFSPLVVEGLILEILAEASRATLDESMPAGPAWLKAARDLIHDSASETITLSSVARAVGVHPSHLARTFRRHYRASIGDYLRRIRIERAARELTQTSHSLAEVSLHTGFFDQSHFSKAFKQHTGLTPAQFRAHSLRNSGTTPRLAS